MIHWSARASEHVAAIWKYIASNRDTEMASAITARIFKAVERLAEFPYMGRAGRRPGTRELVLPPYFVVYRVREGIVSIDAVLHGAQKY